LDPDNGLRIAKGIQNNSAKCAPTIAAYFCAAHDTFEQRLKQSDERWLAQMKPYAGRKVVTYHRSWPNFAEHFASMSSATSSRVRASPQPSAHRG